MTAAYILVAWANGALCVVAWMAAAARLRDAAETDEHEEGT